MSTSEVAEYIRRPTATLHQWRHQGIGPRAIRVGRGLLYRREDVDQWLADLEQQQTADSASRDASGTVTS